VTLATDTDARGHSKIPTREVTARYAHMYVHMHTNMHAYIHAYIHGYIKQYIYTFITPATNTNARGTRDISIYAYICIYTYIHTWMYK